MDKIKFSYLHIFSCEIYYRTKFQVPCLPGFKFSVVLLDWLSTTVAKVPTLSCYLTYSWDWIVILWAINLVAHYMPNSVLWNSHWRNFEIGVICLSVFRLYNVFRVLIFWKYSVVLTILFFFFKFFLVHFLD